MSKKKGKPGIPYKDEEIVFKNRYWNTLASLIEYGDVLELSRKKLIQRGRLQQNNPEHRAKFQTISIQLETLKVVLIECFKATPQEVELAKRRINKGEMEKKIEKMMDTICPIIIHI